MSRRRRPPRPAVSDADVPEVGLREPCPCGSGKRYKNCHGRKARSEASRRVARPFEGLPAEADLVAMREIVPAATLQAPLAVDVQSTVREVTICTVLPFGAAALVRADGTVLVALQTPTSSGDASRDVAAALEQALEAEPGSSIRLDGLPGEGRRLQALVDADLEPTVTVHDGFEFWTDENDPEMQAYVEQANAAAIPTVRLASVEAAYLSVMGDVAYLRWVMLTPEDQLLDALARLRAARTDSLGGETTMLGTFRADGLLVPVWEVPAALLADDLEDPAVEFAERLAAALAAEAPLSADERKARASLTNRQITLNR